MNENPGPSSSGCQKAVFAQKSVIKRKELEGAETIEVAPEPKKFRSENEEHTVHNMQNLRHGLC